MECGSCPEMPVWSSIFLQTRVHWSAKHCWSNLSSGPEAASKSHVRKMFSARVHTAIHPFAGLAEADEKWERPRTAAEPAIDGPRQRQANCVDALPLTIPAFAQCLQSGAAMCCHDGRGSRGHCGPVPSRSASVVGAISSDGLMGSRWLEFTKNRMT